MPTIIHVSDTHFGSQLSAAFPTVELRKKLVDVVSPIVDSAFILVTGDITFKGTEDGYKAALAFFELTIMETTIERSHIFFCPGNHDLEARQPRLRNFDAFTYAVRRDKVCAFAEKSVSIVNLKGLCLILINSVYHSDHRYGLVNLPEIERTLANHETLIRRSSASVVLVHHHLIPLFEHDTSSVRNSYGLLRLLDHYEISLIAHGHQHVHTNLPIGESRVACYGVGSFNFQTQGYTNGLHVYELRGTNLQASRYVYIKDSGLAGGGGFVRLGE